MSQHDFVIANNNGLLFRQDLNLALAALAGNSSGNIDPADAGSDSDGVTYPFQFWVDTSGANPVLKQRNAANSAWITIGRADLQGLGLAGVVASSSAPSSPLDYQFWVDTSGANPILKQWVPGSPGSWTTIGTANQTNLGLLPKTGGTMSGPINYSNKDATYVPVGTDFDRPGFPAQGMIRFNSTSAAFEGYNGTAWAPIGGGGYAVSSTQSISSGGTINSSTTDSSQLRPVVGNGGAQDASLTPFGNTGGWKDGTEITLVGTSDSNSLTLTFNDASKGLVGNFSKIELTKYKMITCVWSSGIDRWLVVGGA